MYGIKTFQFRVNIDDYPDKDGIRDFIENHIKFAIATIGNHLGMMAETIIESSLEKNCHFLIFTFHANLL